MNNINDIYSMSQEELDCFLISRLYESPRLSDDDNLIGFIWMEARYDDRILAEALLHRWGYPSLKALTSEDIWQWLGSVAGKRYEFDDDILVLTTSTGYEVSPLGNRKNRERYFSIKEEKKERVRADWDQLSIGDVFDRITSGID